MADVNAPSGQNPAMAPPRKHRFHLRTDSPLHLSNEEPVLGYLKFSVKATKSEVFGIPIPDSLITAEIQQATYYQEYLAKVTHHRKYLAGETGGVQNPPAPKPTQPARKPKAPTRPSISIPVASTQPAPTSATAKLQENKRKHATETTDKPVKAKRVKRSISHKTRQPRDEDADYQKDVEESMKDAYALPKGPLPPVVIRELESGKYQPLLEVAGKGKAKAGPDPDAQAEDQTGSDAGAQAKGQAGSNPDETSKGQAGSNPNETSKGQAGPDHDHGDAEAKVQSISSLVVHAGSDREHMDLDVADVSPQSSTEPESPKEHQQLKATTTDTTTTTTTTLPPPQALQQSTTEAMMVKRIGELECITADLIQVNKDIEERLDSHGLRLYTLEQLDIPQRVSIAVSEVVTEAVDWAMQAPLCNRFKDSSKADMKEILHQRMWESDSYKSHEDDMQLFEAINEPASGAPKASGSTQMPTSPPPPLSTNQESPSKGSAAPSSSKTAASAEYQAWMTTDIRLRPSISLTPVDLEMDEDMALDEQA
nr:hypothetical protein [Tanacetum cinerariifolium]